MKNYIFIDDWREHRNSDDVNTILCKSALQFEDALHKILQSSNIEQDWPVEISFDFDLGYGANGINCARQLINVCRNYGLPLPAIKIHSEHPSAREKFLECFNEYYGKDHDVKFKIKSQGIFNPCSLIIES